MIFFETSAKTGQNINAAFEGISRDIIKNIESSKSSSDEITPTNPKGAKRPHSKTVLGKDEGNGGKIKKEKCCK